VKKLILAAAAAFGAMHAAAEIEQPAYVVVESDGAFEIRDYPPLIIASVEVSAAQATASNAGFRPLAEYIFGKNSARERIEMTSPVRQVRSQKIEMTAPVTTTLIGEGVWKVSFIMPAKWTLETLPVPDNADVTLSQLPGRRVAAVRYSGTAPVAEQLRREGELLAWMASRKLIGIGAPEGAFFDPPWTLGPFRRNEVMVPIAGAAPAPG
jgi:SOUL heme-binding protein